MPYVLATHQPEGSHQVTDIFFILFILVEFPFLFHFLFSENFLLAEFFRILQIKVIHPHHICSQELLEAVERERSFRFNPTRNAAIFHHPTLGDFELQHVCMLTINLCGQSWT